MFLKKFVMALIIMFVAVFFLGCGKKETPGENNDKGGDKKANETKTETVKGKTPEQLGENYGNEAHKLYLDALKELTAIIKDKPEPSDVEEKVKELKETYIKKFVELGRKREALEKAGKDMYDKVLADAIVNKTASTEIYKAYNEANKQYFGVNQNFFKLTNSFNIITQYSDFELLKKQEPKEAERLGIK